MALSKADLSANELAWAAADKPMISSNALQSARPGDISIKWVSGTTSGTSASADDTNSSYPTHRMYDGLPGLYSKGTTTSKYWTIVIDASSNPIEFDWFGVVGHNLWSRYASQLIIEVSDLGTFASPLAVTSKSNPYNDMIGNHRYSIMSLSNPVFGTAERFSDVSWVRIRLTLLFTGVPQIGQLILGRSRQQQFGPVVPWDPTSQVSDMHFRETPSGARLRNPRYKARRELSATFRHSLSSLHTDTLAFWSNIRNGCDPFYYHDSPSSDIHNFNMLMFREQSIQYPQISAKSRDLTIDAVEQGPNFLSLE